MRKGSRSFLHSGGTGLGTPSPVAPGRGTHRGSLRGKTVSLQTRDAGVSDSKAPCGPSASGGGTAALPGPPGPLPPPPPRGAAYQPDTLGPRRGEAPGEPLPENTWPPRSLLGGSLWQGHVDGVGEGRLAVERLLLSPGSGRVALTVSFTAPPHPRQPPEAAPKSRRSWRVEAEAGVHHPHLALCCDEAGYEVGCRASGSSPRRRARAGGRKVTAHHGPDRRGPGGTRQA